MKRFQHYITEVHFSDYYHKNFVAFRQKYSKLVKDLEIEPSKHFVQFSNYKEDKLDKTASQIVDHHDPVGTYGYPIEYVLKHPADIWYGYNAKFLRVLKAKHPEKILDLQKISEHDAINYIFKLKIGDGWNDSENTYNKMRKYLRKNGSSIQTQYSPGRIFFACIQLNPKEEFEDTAWGETKKKLKIRPSQEQTELLLKLGYTAMQDTAKNQKHAVINDREPEQIVFLRRDAFDVVEVVSLNQKSDHISTTLQPEKIERPFVAQIAELLDDKISEGPERSSLGGWSYYWTKKGRRIEIEFGWDFERYTANLKMGEKPHKRNKLYDKHSYEVVIRSEFGGYGKIKFKFGRDLPFKEALKAIQRGINEAKHTEHSKDQQSTWEPENHKQFLEKEKEKQRLNFWKSQNPKSFLGSERDYYKEKFGDSWYEEMDKDKNEKINDTLYKKMAEFLGIKMPEPPELPMPAYRLHHDYIRYLENEFGEQSYPMFLKSIKEPKILDDFFKTVTNKDPYLK